MKQEYTILGAGVIGLTTALELAARYPGSKIHICAKFFPGDKSIEYTSPWAGANWSSVALDSGRQEKWDEVTYLRFKQMSEEVREAGVRKLELRAFYDSVKEDAGVLSAATGKIWYEELVGGLRPLSPEVLAEKQGSVFGFDMDSFVIDVPIYLSWLHIEAMKAGVQFHRRIYAHINEAFAEFPTTRTFFNCTGIGSYHLGGVEDKTLYPTRGQVLLVETPKTPLTRMYFRSPQRVNKDTTYVFPRNPSGGVILGGCRVDNEWDGEVDMEFAKDIMRRCCALAPELGKPEDLKVISHGVGLRREF
ncbi:putative D-amino acid oxidase [Coleophoma cylindrospora]|uniref:Putative D-amino acid oxidase n=1 Tax=Coleophoma cylindrospora TaxID=1849047 RepID=A0A3D8QJP0_9HELO|nr:putative D-amino acid oxidase [Coleophoma cylindrospora]